MHVQKVITLSSHTNRRNPTPTARRSSSPGTSSASLLVLIQSVAQHWSRNGTLTALVGGVRVILTVYRRDEPLGLALGASFLALFVHALFYSGFLEDPLTWLVLGMAAAYCAQPARTPA